MTISHSARFTELLHGRLSRLYPEAEVPDIQRFIEDLLSVFRASMVPAKTSRWDERDILLITYGDSLCRGDEQPLAVLCRFLEQRLAGIISTVHILPFFPYSSDDGFSVIDYRLVNPELGDWAAVERLGKFFDLMFDLVINHVSSRHQWFQNFLNGVEPGAGYFITPPDEADLAHVVRPRDSALLTPFTTANGEQHVWTTFSADQIDVDFRNPAVLAEYISLLLFYLERGARFVRLDAIAFLWKEWGTGCLNLPETHEVVHLLRDILDEVSPKTVLLTETNVPHQQNISYFGDSDEAHMVYQFSLAPLLLHSLYRGTSHYLTEWARTSALAPPGCTYLNFTASHDGIGMRPLEGLLPQGEIELLLKGMEKFGGRISYRSQADGGKSAYEINITYFDALKGTWLGTDSWQLARFFLAQTVMLGLRGIPAVYIHSLLATENDQDAVERGGRARLINRHKWDLDVLEELLFQPQSNQAIVFNELRRRIKIRSEQPAFHPDARQRVLFLGEHLFGFWRHSRDGEQTILAIHNLTDQPRHLYLDGALDGTLEGFWSDLLTGGRVNTSGGRIKLPPYHVYWLVRE
ncbi:MAG: alpha-amylase [Desulfuromonas sp.]|nr:MAG: alpha-amylase [Desulfuromonas sp.]